VCDLANGAWFASFLNFTIPGEFGAPEKQSKLLGVDLPRSHHPVLRFWQLKKRRNGLAHGLEKTEEKKAKPHLCKRRKD
jgi:hypothetical protein